ncbi:hypothetical protein ColKHC_10485 [Colletotrichum higginsianum]|nr:hypothetical protein ColKHC_10485 [Colletotrichum higginsianum]
MSQNEVFDAESRFAGLTLLTHTALNPDDEAFFNLSDEELLARSVDLFPDWPRWPGSLAPGIDQEDWSIWRDEEVGTEGRLRRLKLERRRSEEYFAWLAQFDCCAGCAEDASVINLLRMEIPRSGLPWRLDLHDA